jgi:hypothetical protein
LDAGAPHLTQFPQVQEMQKMSEEQFNKFFEDPNNLFWPEPMTLTLGKASVQTTESADVLSDLSAQPSPDRKLSILSAERRPGGAWLALGGPWFYYNAFRTKHGLQQLKSAEKPEIGVKAGTNLIVPLVVGGLDSDSNEVKIEAIVPLGWKIVSGAVDFRLPKGIRSDLFVEIATPDLSKDELKKNGAQEIVVRGTADGKSIGEVRLKVILKASALAQ